MIERYSIPEIREVFKDIFKDIFVEKIEKESISKGTAVTVWARYENTILGYDSIGEIGKRAEEVGKEAAQGLKEEILKRGCVDKFMSDQILIFMALAKNSRVLSSELTDHAKSCFKLIPEFTGEKFSIEEKNGAFEVRV